MQVPGEPLWTQTYTTSLTLNIWQRDRSSRQSMQNKWARKKIFWIARWERRTTFFFFFKVGEVRKEERRKKWQPFQISWKAEWGKRVPSGGNAPIQAAIRFWNTHIHIHRILYPFVFYAKSRASSWSTVFLRLEAMVDVRENDHQCISHFRRSSIPTFSPLPPL